MKVTHPDVQTAMDKAYEFAGRFYRVEPRKRVIVFVGQPGCGKTHILEKLAAFARAIAVTAWSHGGWRAKAVVPRSGFFSWPSVASEFEKKNFETMDDLKGLDFVAIDDIGAENDAWKVATDRLCQVLSAREEKFTAITTNIRQASWDERFDERVADRLMRNSVVVDMSQVPSFSTLPIP